MIIGVTINNILRDHISQLTKLYTTIVGEDPILPINPFDLEKSFPTIDGNEEVDDWELDKEFTLSLNDNTIENLIDQ
jgi:hypothetical protein